MTTNKGLQVWLPLTDASHCENQGLVGKLTCTTTPTFVDGGKLGKCLSTGEYQMSAAQTTKVFNNNHLTIAFWVYIDAATGASTPRSVFIGNEGMGANNNRKFTIMQYPTVNDLHCSWMNDAAYNIFISIIIENALPSYKWTHVAITYENPTAIIYINGVEVRRDTGVSNSSTFAYTTPIIKYNTGRRINDFRIYSYALSPQEIKELSRGKVGHWLGDGNGFHIPNILTYTPENFSHHAANGSYTNTTEGNTRKCTVTTTSTSWNYSYYDLGTAVIDTLTANTKYTVSFSFKSDNTYDIIIDIKCRNSKYLLSSTSSVAYNASMVGKWKRLAVTLTTNTLANRANSNTQVLYFRRFNKVGTYYIKDIMFQKGEADSCYTTSTSQAFLSDISGFGRHGQVVGNVTLAGDTPRYDKSLKYNGGNVVVTGLPTMSTYTISWWDKFPTGTGLLFDWRLGPVDTTMGSSSAGVVIDNNTCYFKIGGVATDYQNYSNYDITANTWYHCCLVCDDSKSRLYINGIQKWEANKGSIADFSQLILGGRNAAANDGYQYTGQHSDFRIYATALSADDVKELYSLGH